MTDILLFKKKCALAIVSIDDYREKIIFFNHKKELVEIPVRMIFTNFDNRKSGAILIASDEEILSSHVIEEFRRLNHERRRISYYAIARVFQEFECAEGIKAFI